MTPTPAISIVVVAYQAREDLVRCLASLATQPDRSTYEVLVLDNGSTDGTDEMLASRYPEVRRFRNATNVGLTPGLNQLCREARGELICLLDADTIVQHGAVSTLAEFLRRHPDAGVAAGRMLNPDGSIQETARKFPKPLNGIFGRQTLLTRLFPGNRFSQAYLDRRHIDEQVPFEVDWVAAACMMFRRALLDEVGPFDEGYFVYWVDADWCWRVRQAHRAVWCVPAARVTHVEQNRTGRRKSARAIRSFHDGAYRFYRKHYVRTRWSPSLFIAWAGLSVRCRLILAANAARR
jgi:hypothetical protein